MSLEIDLMYTPDCKDWETTDAILKQVLEELGLDASTGRHEHAQIIAENLHRPAVRAAKSATEAEKVLRKELERELLAEQRMRMGAKKSKHTLLHGDFLQLADTMPSKKYSVIITDPPYGINAGDFGVNVRNAMNTHGYTDTPTYAEALYTFLAEWSFKHFAADEAHIYVFHAIEYFQKWQELFHSVGWDVWPKPLIWYKHTGNIPKPDLGPRHDYEAILFANKGNMAVNAQFSDVIDIANIRDKRHAAEKPVEVYQNLLERSAIAGQEILDPFCGTGTVFEAAQNVGCVATGVELDEATLAIAQERINELEV